MVRTRTQIVGVALTKELGSLAEDVDGTLDGLRDSEMPPFRDEVTPPGPGLELGEGTLVDDAITECDNLGEETAMWVEADPPCELGFVDAITESDNLAEAAECVEAEPGFAGDAITDNLVEAAELPLVWVEDDLPCELRFECFVDAGPCVLELLR